MESECKWAPKHAYKQMRTLLTWDKGSKIATKNMAKIVKQCLWACSHLPFTNRKGMEDFFNNKWLNPRKNVFSIWNVYDQTVNWFFQKRVEIGNTFLIEFLLDKRKMPIRTSLLIDVVIIPNLSWVPHHAKSTTGVNVYLENFIYSWLKEKSCTQCIRASISMQKDKNSSTCIHCLLQY